MQQIESETLSEPVNDSVLTDFTAILPEHHLSQPQILSWLKAAHLTSERTQDQHHLEFPLERYLDRYSVKKELVSERYFECGDVFNSDFEMNQIYRITKAAPSGKGILRRNQFFSKRAEKVLHQFYPENETPPDHLIHVTCTGYISPSAVQLLVASRNWNTSVTHAYHMGCYASLPSIRLATAIHESSQKRVDIVHTEMCSLHLNPAVHTPEQIVVQTLFADGHIRYSLKSEAEVATGLKILAVKEKIIPATSEDMTWIAADFGMQMTLSRDVPAKLQAVIHAFFHQLCDEVGLKKTELLRDAIFAIHPGGPKIIDSIQSTLELEDHQVRASRKVLFERGNMSSATLPHVWRDILENGNDGKSLVVSFAFGPGLTLFGSIFKLVKR